MTAARSAKTTAAEPTKQIGDVVTVQKEAIESVVKAGTDAASKNVDKAVALTREQVDAAVQASAVAFQSYEDLLRFNKENVEALVQSGSIVARGMQDFSKSFVTLAQQSIDEQMAAGRAMIGAKSLKEVFDVSSSLAKANLEKLMAESTRLTEVSTKLAEEAFAPITVRVNAAVERLTKPAA